MSLKQATKIRKQAKSNGDVTNERLYKDIADGWRRFWAKRGVDAHLLEQDFRAVKKKVDDDE